MYKLETSSKDSDSLSSSFHESIETGEKEMTNYKTTDGNFQGKIYLEEVFDVLSTKKRLQLKKDIN